MSAFADNIILLRHVELCSQLCRVIFTSSTNCVGPVERVRLSHELANARAETWPVS